MRKISANLIFDGLGNFLKNGIIVLNDDAVVLDLIDTGGDLKESEGIEFYNGLLVPGFVNCHCHIELSHLKDRISANTGITDFIKAVNTKRDISEIEQKKSIETADKEMSVSGIVAVGDISNNDLSFGIKKISKIAYHTFIELFGLNKEKSEFNFRKAKEIFIKNREYHSISLSPHSHYSCSPDLLKEINKFNYENAVNNLLSIHNQESVEEQDFAQNASGDLYELMSSYGLDKLLFNRNLAESLLIGNTDLLPQNANILLIHNVFTNSNDIAKLSDLKIADKLYFVICPNSNLFISGRIADLKLFESCGLNICLGTDSLASNYSLSILNELITLEEHFPDFPLSKTLKWATSNGAKALMFENKFGSFSKYLKPGVNLITDMDLHSMKLTKDAKIKVLV